MNLGNYAEVRGRGNTLLYLGYHTYVPRRDIFQCCYIEICTVGFAQNKDTIRF